MTAARQDWPAQLLHYWFHSLTPAQWFGPDPQVDAELRRRFGRVIAMLARSPAREFLADRTTARAAVMLFDQVPRNLYRGDYRAFAHDRLARAIVHGALQRGWDRGLTVAERQFLYMPLMHSEVITDQRRSLELFATLHSSFILGFARSHYRMIARFGRFPHRNEALDRRSTEAERRAVAAGNAW